MTNEEREHMREWVRQWQRAAPVLEKLRIESIQRADTVWAVEALGGLLEGAVRDCPPPPSSGLVEQQAVFAKARR